MSREKSFSLPPGAGKRGRPEPRRNPNPRKLPPAVDAERRQLPLLLTPAEAWNKKYPVGTRVRYFPVLPPREYDSAFAPVDTVTRSEAWTLLDGSPVVKLECRTGGVHLRHVIVLP